ncbi:hypothetical protein ECANGB1_250 [Enterospora canceri]|uniref:Uncharacterized protein n=1 Tax=Enterospora canceri TaxID=1081671 RepID=A0A1Y1S3L9_9MICR|nr:hypothetical protein ECANGB1_250 [Enterospora canceri]
MKKGLVSDKLIINGQVECLIEYVKTVGNGVIKQGSELNRKMDPEEYEIQKEEENADDDNMSVEEYSGSDDVQYTDLIKMCEGYQGIKDIETCKFPDSKPTGLKFFKKFSHLENKILKLKSILKTISLLKSRSTRKWISIE